MRKFLSLSLAFSLSVGISVANWPAARGQEKAPSTRATLGKSGKATAPPLDGEEIRQFGEHKGHIISVAFSPDGKSVASTGFDQTVKVWDPTSGKLMLNLQGHAGGAVDDVAFSRDSKHLVSAGAGDATVKLWNASTGAEVFTLRGHRSSVYGAAFSPDGKHVASGSGDQTVKVWEAASGKEVRTLKAPGMGLVFRVAYSRNGKFLASSGLAPKVWDAESGQEIRSFGKAATLVVFSPDSQKLATATGSVVSVWDLANGHEILTFSAQSTIWGLAFSPDGTRLATAGDRTVKIWDSANGKEELALAGHTDLVRCVVFSPDGRQILSGGNDLTVRLWQLTGGERRVKIDNGNSLNGTWSCMSLRHDGRDAPDDFVRDHQVVITGDRYVTKRHGKVVSESTCKLDATKKSKTIELTFDLGPNKGQIQQGIYVMDGDTLIICGGEPGNQRPTEFASKSGSSHILMVLKRESSRPPPRITDEPK